MILYAFILYNPTITISRMEFCSVLVSHMFFSFSDMHLVVQVPSKHNDGLGRS